jgi:hypothetical protein|tara:strand:+ start:5067 stop:5456 length:390 start_codon:yes stop_codon:yes gene_type:complete
MNNTDKADKLTAIYIKMREAIRGKEEEIKEIKVQQDKITEELDLFFGEKGESLRLKSGTVSRRLQTVYQVSNWDEMHNFVLEHKAAHLLEKRVHGRNMKEFLEVNPDVVPPSLQVIRKHTISVRKPSKK